MKERKTHPNGFRCIDCGTVIASSTAKRCNQCNGKFYSKNFARKHSSKKMPSARTGE